MEVNLEPRLPDAGALDHVIAKRISFRWRRRRAENLLMQKGIGHSKASNICNFFNPGRRRTIRSYFPDIAGKWGVDRSVEMSRRSGACLGCCLVVFAVVSALAVSGPALYWWFKKSVGVGHSKASCPPCVCNCPPPLSLLKIAPGLANLSVTDCGSNDPDLKHEMKKQLANLLDEELKLEEAVTEEHGRQTNITFAVAKKVASQYQKEAEKCNVATESCEQARERAEAMLIKERKGTSLWERRARQLGWEDE